MSFLNRWSKKTEKEQLKAAEKKVGVKTADVADKKEVTADKKETTPKKKKANYKNDFAYKILVRPLVSEKAAIAESQNVYTFVVSNKATKIDIKNTIKQVYNVAPIKVRIVNMEGKDVRFGRNLGIRKDWKKAMVTLPKGQSINIHEGV